MPVEYLDNTIHDFHKVNLVSLRDGSDKYKCTKCGISGKRPMLSDVIHINNSVNQKKLKECDGTPVHIEMYAGRVITIGACTASGIQFSNLVPGSKHVVIPVPEGEKPSSRVVWVNGVGVPVGVLHTEISKISKFKRNRIIKKNK